MELINNVIISFKKQAKRIEKDETLIPKIKLAIRDHDRKAFKERVEKAKENLHFNINDTDENGMTLLHYCIENNSFFLFEELLKMGADVTKPSCGESLLKHMILSIRKSHADTAGFSVQGPKIKILVLLINHPKTNLKELIDKDCLLRYIAHMVRTKDLDGLTPEKAALIQTLKNVIMTAHRYELRGSLKVDDHQIDLEGFGFGVAAEEMITTYQQFLANTDIQQDLNTLYNSVYQTKGVDYFDPHREEADVATLLQAELSCMGQPLGIKEFLQRDSQHEITPAYVSCTIKKRSDHAIAYLFYQNLCVRVNCGGSTDPEEIPGIKFYTIGDKKAFLEEIPAILNSLRFELKDSYLHTEFAKKAKLKLVFTVERPAQQAGNCTFRTLEEVQYALFILHFYKHFSKIHAKPWNRFITNEHGFLESAQVMAEKCFNLLMHFDKDLGALKLKAVDKYLTEALRAEIANRRKEIEQRDATGKGWHSAYRGIKEPTPPKDAHSETMTEDLTFNNKDILSYYKNRVDATKKVTETESKNRIERLFLTRQEMETFAKVKGKVKDSDIKALFEILNSNEAGGKESALYLNFIANLEGVDFISFIKDESSYSIGFRDAKYSAEVQALLFDRDFARSQKW